MKQSTSRVLIAVGVSVTALAVLSWLVFSGHVGGTTLANGADDRRNVNPFDATGPSASASGSAAGSPSASASPSTSANPSGTPKPTASGPTSNPPVARGGGKPGPGNTGVPAGTKLTVVNGNKIIDKPGVYTNLDVHGFVQVFVKGVTIRNSIIRGGVPKCNSAALYVVEPDGGLTIEDSEIAPDHPSPCLDGAWAINTTMTRMNIHGAVDGLKAFDNTIVQDSWIHDLSYFASDPNQNGGPTHNDGVQTYEGNKHITLRHNNFAMIERDNATYQLSQDGGKVATDIHVENNWLDGGGCTLNFAHIGGPTPMTGIYVVNNRFGRNSHFGCPILVSTQTILSQNSGNVFDDNGKPIPAPDRHD